MASVQLSAYTTNSSNYAIGSIQRSGNGSWTTTRTGTITGTASQTGSTARRVAVGWTGGGRGSFTLARFFAWFDVSLYQTATITSAELTIPTTPSSNLLAFPVIAVDATSAYSNLSTTTLNQNEFTGTSFNAYSSNTSWTQTTGFQQITLNANGIAAIQAGNNFGIAIIDYSYDYQNSAPSGLAFDAYYRTDMSTATQRSKHTLDLNYTAAGWGGGDVNAVVNSDIGNMNAVALSDIGKLNGVS